LAGVRGFRDGDAVRHAEASDAGKLQLSTRPWNHAIRAVCEAHGFVEEAYLRRECLGMGLVQYAYFTELAIDGVDPAVTAGNRPNLYAHPYEEFRVELRPAQGAVLIIEKPVPAVHSTVMVIE